MTYAENSFNERDGSTGLQVARKLFEFSQIVQNPELIADTIMTAYYVRRDEQIPPLEDPGAWSNLTLYDRDWQQLDELGVPRPIEEDPRQKTVQIEDMPIQPSLWPSSLFKTRSQLEKEYTELVLSKRREAVDELARLCDEVTEIVGFDVARKIIEMAGLTFDTNGNFQITDIDEQVLETTREITKVMSPVFRDLVRMNAHLFTRWDPDALLSVIGTEIENPENRKAYEFIRNIVENSD